MAEYAVSANGVDQYLLINDNRIDLDQGETLIWIGTLETKIGGEFHYILSTGPFDSSNFHVYYSQVHKYFGAKKLSQQVSQNGYADIELGTPHLVAAQRDSSNGTYAIVCEAGGTAEYLEVATNTSQTVPTPWYVMRRGDHSTDRYAKGQTHLMAFFSAATDLSKADIEAIAAGADPTTFGGILLNWPMNEGTGLVTTDTQEGIQISLEGYDPPNDDSQWVLLSDTPVTSITFDGVPLTASAELAQGTLQKQSTMAGQGTVVEVSASAALKKVIDTDAELVPSSVESTAVSSKTIPLDGQVPADFSVSASNSKTVMYSAVTSVIIDLESEMLKQTSFIGSASATASTSAVFYNTADYVDAFRFRLDGVVAVQSESGFTTVNQTDGSV